jgi:hypothetical protein
VAYRGIRAARVIERFLQQSGRYPWKVLVATRAAAWEVVAFELRVIARRLMSDPPRRRLPRACTRDLGRLLEALEAVPVPASYRRELALLAAIVAATAGVPSWSRARPIPRRLREKRP